MKKVLSSLVFASVLLLCSQCRINNVDAVPKIIDTPNGGKMVVFGTPVLKENVVILDTASAKQLSIVGNRLIVRGEVITKSVANGRIASTKLRVGNIVIMESVSSFIDGVSLIIDRLVGETQDPVTGFRVEFECHVVEGPNEIFDSFHAIFSVFNINAYNGDLNLEGDYYTEEKKEVLSPTTVIKKERRVGGYIKSHFNGYIKKAVDYEINIQNSQIVKLQTIRKEIHDYALRLELNGRFVFKHSKEVGIPIEKKQTFFPGGIPILVGIQLVKKLNVEGSLTGTIDYTKSFYSRKYEKTTIETIQPDENGQLVKRVTERIDQDDYNFANEMRGKFAGNIRFGVEGGVSSYLYKETFIKISGTVEIYIKADLSCSSGGKGLHLVTSLYVRPKLVLEFIFLKEIFNNQEFKFEYYEDYQLASSNFDFNVLFDFCGVQVEVLPDLSQFEQFKVLLIQRGFPINEGASPPVLSGSSPPFKEAYFGSPVGLIYSTYTNDEYDYSFKNNEIIPSKAFGPIKFRFSSQSPEGIMVEIKRNIDLNNQVSAVNSSYDVCNKAVISGSGQRFTIIGLMTGQLFASTGGVYSTYDSYFAISGEVIAAGVVTNVHYATQLIRTYGETQSRVNPPNGTFRHFKVASAVSKMSNDNF
ncbi:hypothetical protein P1X15_13215 [Runella sp. MFBS21]|uniref:hypothetical protein n=1 Tax=Runella sp. MFBS21 TaxID=3034018 RepID=UPI0023F710CE|nr:hypothetical protein [Runella sp. MFBS21]MDF7818568.1 hypothetical protein [Runella sp. MFBS21]